jgi:hypothetical protein
VELNYLLGKDPTIHGAADHLLYVGRKLWDEKIEGSGSQVAVEEP